MRLTRASDGELPVILVQHTFLEELNHAAPRKLFKLFGLFKLLKRPLKRRFIGRKYSKSEF